MIGQVQEFVTRLAVIRRELEAHRAWIEARLRVPRFKFLCPSGKVSEPQYAESRGGPRG